MSSCTVTEIQDGTVTQSKSPTQQRTPMELHEYSTGAVRSTDADHVRYDLITPIGLREVALVYQNGLPDCLNRCESQNELLDQAITQCYEFLSGDNEDALSLAAICVLEAIQCGEENSKIGWTTGYQDRNGWSMLPEKGLQAVAAAYGEGSTKYGDFNWERGMPVCSLINHAINHIMKSFSDANQFVESEEDDLGHAAWNLLGAIHSLWMWPHLNKYTLRGPGCVRPEPEPVVTVRAPEPVVTVPEPATNAVKEVIRVATQEEGDKGTNLPPFEVLFAGESPPVLYLSGPMTGYEELNFPAFYAAETALRKLGFQHILNPADYGFCPNKTWEDNLKRDLVAVGECDIMVMLPGWENSKGAVFESYVAKTLGKATILLNNLIPSVV